MLKNSDILTIFVLTSSRELMKNINKPRLEGNRDYRPFGCFFKMKTNQIMKVNFGDHVLTIGHKDQMGNLNELVTIANEYRKRKGLSEL